MQGLEQEMRLAWFKRVVLPHEAALRRYLATKLRNRSDLDDIVSETLIRAYATENFQRFDNGRAYLMTIAKNLICDEVRRSRIVSFEAIVHLNAEPADNAPSPERIVSGRDEVRRLLRLVSKLPRQCRRVFVLRRVHDYTPPEIAEELNLSVSTVEKHLTRAMVLLTKMLAEEALSENEPAASDRWPARTKKTL